MSEDIPKKLEKQNEVIISLLGRMAFTAEKIHDIIVKKKQNPQAYPILQEWEELGIIYESYKLKGKFYKKLFPI